MKPSDPVRAPHQRRKGARPNELLAAALSLFVEKGYAGTRLEEIASRAGVTKATLYLYFENKAQLLKAVVEAGIGSAVDHGETLATDFSGSASELLRRMLMTWWDIVGESKLSGLCKLMLAESSNFPEITAYYHDEVIARGQAIVRRVLEAGIVSGEFRQMNVDTAIDTIFSPVLKLMLWRHSFARDADVDPKTYLNEHLDLVLDGIHGRRKS